MTCGQCKHFEKTEMKNWGYCVAPIPKWVEEIDESVTFPNTVWAVQDHSQNYAYSCELFTERGEELI